MTHADRRCVRMATINTRSRISGAAEDVTVGAEG